MTPTHNASLIFRRHLQNDHLTAYNEHPNSKKKKLTEAAKRTDKFDSSTANRMLARLTARSTTALNQASSEDLRNFCSYLNPVYKLPSRDTITTLILDETTRIKNRIMLLLSEVRIVSLIITLNPTNKPPRF
jgi:hypothetical protein